MLASDLINRLHELVEIYGDKEIWIIPSNKMRKDIEVLSSDAYYSEIGRNPSEIRQLIGYEEGTFRMNPPEGYYIDYTDGDDF